MAANQADLSERERATVEGVKLMFDAIKHLTTLSTGIVLIIIALLEKFFTAPRWKLAVAGSIFFFALSAVMSVRTMVALSAFVADRSRTDPGVSFYRITSLSFVFGLIFLGVFVIRNLWK